MSLIALIRAVVACVLLLSPATLPSSPAIDASLANAGGQLTTETSQPAAASNASTAAKQRAAKVQAQAKARAAQKRRGYGKPAGPVWLSPSKPHPQNPTNPLARRVWGVYEGPQDQVWKPYMAATGTTREALATIAERPRTKWYGSYLADNLVRSAVTSYIASSQDGDAEALAQFAVFRMVPWEHEACTRPTTPAEAASYRTWITELAAGIGSAHTLIVMQPDGPFLLCAPDRAAKSELLTWATKTLSDLPNTSVYIDAGAADWCENGTAQESFRCAEILKLAGIEHARGFALDSTHYTGPEENIARGKEILDVLKADGYAAKHFIIDTAKSGQPTMWNDMIPATPKDLTDNARTCKTRSMTRCVTLGIPPTARPADRQWDLSRGARKLAARHVDGFVWFGRPWLFNQADPFVTERALDMVASTPWTATGPR